MYILYSIHIKNVGKIVSVMMMKLKRPGTVTVTVRTVLDPFVHPQNSLEA
jgi:hypothetical protein